MSAPGYVLVVDDEEDIRETLREVIEMEGCTARLAANADEAMVYLRQDERPCLVILDLLMPGRTGAELLAEMRADEKLADMTVVMSTSAPSRAPKGVPLLPKPVDIDALFGWIRRACRCAVK